MRGKKVAPRKVAKRKIAPKKRGAVTIAKGVRLARGEESKLRKKPGGGSVGKYKTVAKGAFCGPAGGSPRGSFPVNTKKRARNALARAHNAPNPAGIKACVRKRFPEFKKTKKGK